MIFAKVLRAPFLANTSRVNDISSDEDVLYRDKKKWRANLFAVLSYRLTSCKFISIQSKEIVLIHQKEVSHNVFSGIVCV